MTNSSKSFSNDETFLQYFLVILTRASELLENLEEKYYMHVFVPTTCIIYLACSNFQPHNSELTVANGQAIKNKSFHEKSLSTFFDWMILQSLQTFNILTTCDSNVCVFIVDQYIY